MVGLSSSFVRALFQVTPRWLHNSVFLIALLATLPALAFAQEATIVGTATDPSGGVIANVTVTITNEQTGTTRTLTTNSFGQYVAPGLPIGAYDLKAESPGFKVMESRGVALNL